MPFQFALEDYLNMLQRRGFKESISVGAFDGDQLVGFILNGSRIIEGKLTAYDVMPGIIPSSRGQGLSKELFKMVKKIFLENQVQQYVLDVLQENQRALKLYQNQGFQISRSYQIFKLEQ